MWGDEGFKYKGEVRDIACSHRRAHSNPTTVGDHSTVGVYPLYNWWDAHIHSAGQIEDVSWYCCPRLWDGNSVLKVWRGGKIERYSTREILFSLWLCQLSLTSWKCHHTHEAGIPLQQSDFPGENGIDTNIFAFYKLSCGIKLFQLYHRIPQLAIITASLCRLVHAQLASFV